ncbi:hypothetical protein EC957_006719 [Mortierella hygrophila]|uniref:GH16 domain-containing protein n=1 Tax=Mortierella hygrophila TaxID=979708 RepID=A0A9P6EZA8_9FUNG|nr:hypothetical protein EC957_006719 [Mortierella hygrophila]
MKFRQTTTRLFSLALTLALITSIGSSAIIPSTPAANSKDEPAIANADTTNITLDISAPGSIIQVSTNVRIGSGYSADPALFSDEFDFNVNETETSPSPNSNPMGHLSVSSLVKHPLPVRPFVDSLSSYHVTVPQNYVIPDGTGPLRWSCVYNRRNVVMTPWGTQISITKSNGLPIPAPPGSKRPPHPGRPYNCGEMISRDRGIGYGKYSVDMVSTDLRGHVTAMFLIAHSSAPGGGSEIDIELTGLDPTAVWLTVWKGSTQQAVKVPLGFDASKGWHTYSVEWQPEFIAWSVDGKEVLRRTDLWTADPRTPGVEYKLAMNSWTHDVEENLWAGKFYWPTNRRQPVMGQFRNVRFIPAAKLR